MTEDDNELDLMLANFFQVNQINSRSHHFKSEKVPYLPSYVIMYTSTPLHKELLTSFYGCHFCYDDHNTIDGFHHRIRAINFH